jgi:hypothetical protein
VQIQYGLITAEDVNGKNFLKAMNPFFDNNAPVANNQLHKIEVKLQISFHKILIYF